MKPVHAVLLSAEAYQRMRGLLCDLLAGPGLEWVEREMAAAFELEEGTYGAAIVEAVTRGDEYAAALRAAMELAADRQKEKEQAGHG